MAIELRQPGEAGLYAQAGLEIGQAERAKEDRARAERAAEQAAVDRARQVAQEWDLQKALFNEQQDFAHEQRLRQADLEAEARAKEWEVQKMQLRSQMDFQQEETARQEQVAEYWATEKYIDSKKAGGVAEEQIENMRFMNDYKHEKLGLPEITARLGSSPEYVQKVQGVRTQRPVSVSEEQWGLLTPEERLKAARVHAGLQPRAGAEKGIFTPANVQKGLGVLSTGSPVSVFGSPLPVLKTKEEHETWAVTEWGPDWKLHVPEAIDVINRKFGLTESKPLSRATMQQFLLAAGGNVEQAKQLAKQSGYKAE